MDWKFAAACLIGMMLSTTANAGDPENTILLQLKDGTVVNQPANVVPSEMLRLNTAISPKAKGAQNNFGVAGGDLAGFPNGRRPGDDVVDIELRVAMGALCVLTGATDALNVGCAPGDAPAGAAPITDGVLTNDSFYDAAFPYLTTPLPGAPAAQ